MGKAGQTPGEAGASPPQTRQGAAFSQAEMAPGETVPRQSLAQVGGRWSVVGRARASRKGKTRQLGLK